MQQITEALNRFWTDLLNFVGGFVNPDWTFVISLMPYLLVLGLVGPVLSLVMLGWMHNRMVLRRGRVRYVDPEPRRPETDEQGVSVIPPNTPYCARDDLLYPPRATICAVCRDELTVICPVDDAVRPASQRVCRACGTKYVLGAGSDPLTVRGTPHPPEGGAAVA